MTVDYKVQLDFQKVELGYVKTNDDSLIVVRVAIIDVKPTGKTGAFLALSSVSTSLWTYLFVPLRG